MRSHAIMDGDCVLHFSLLFSCVRAHLRTKRICEVHVRCNYIIIVCAKRTCKVERKYAFSIVSDASKQLTVIYANLSRPNHRPIGAESFIRSFSCLTCDRMRLVDIWNKTQFILNAIKILTFCHRYQRSMSHRIIVDCQSRFACFSMCSQHDRDTGSIHPVDWSTTHNIHLVDWSRTQYWPS